MVKNNISIMSKILMIKTKNTLLNEKDLNNLITI